jgi:hypothetical protein
LELDEAHSSKRRSGLLLRRLEPITVAAPPVSILGRISGYSWQDIATIVRESG